MFIKKPPYPKRIMITIEEYLISEGHKDCSGTALEEILADNLNGPRLEKYHELMHMLESCNTQKEVKEFYDYCLEAGITQHFENGLWEGTVKRTAIVNKHIRPGMLAIDLGCGEGLRTIFYALINPDTRFYGSDIRKNALMAAKARGEKYHRTNLRLLAADNTSPPLKEVFDLAISDHNLHETQKFWDPYDDFGSKLKSISGMLKQGGKAVILLSPHSAGALQGLLSVTAKAAGLEPEFSTFSYTRYSDNQTDLVMKATKTG